MLKILIEWLKYFRLLNQNNYEWYFHECLCSPQKYVSLTEYAPNACIEIKLTWNYTT